MCPMIKWMYFCPAGLSTAIFEKFTSSSGRPDPSILLLKNEEADYYVELESLWILKLK